MTDNFFEELDKGFGDSLEPIREIEKRIAVLRVMPIGIDNLLKSIESLSFIEDISDPDYYDNFRETLEQLDRFSSRLLEGIERPNTTLSPEEIDIGNNTNPEEPIRDPLVRWAGFEALRFYIRYLLELIAEGELSERLSGPDSAEIIQGLRNTFLSLGVLVIRLSEGLEADRKEETESRPGDSAESLPERKARIESVKLILEDIRDLNSEIELGNFAEFISKPEEIIFVDSRLHWMIKTLIAWAETIDKISQEEGREELSILRADIWRLRARIAEPEFLGRIHSPEGENLIGEIELSLANIEAPLREILSGLEAEHE